MKPYPRIVDWSAEGRRALVAAHESEIRCLLEETFSLFLDEPEASLRAYGFRGDDPVIEAADWSLLRFRDGDIDSARISPEDRSLQLFTRARFWLSQKVGEPNRRRIEAERLGRGRSDVAIEGVAGGPGAGVEHSDTALAVATALKALATRTCPTIVAYWFRGAAAMRAAWFGWEVPGPAVPAGVSGKDHSFFTADALFRFSALFGNLVPTAGPVTTRACVETWFSPCADSPPFRVLDDEVARRLGLATTREAQRERHAGILLLIHRVLDAAEATVGERDADGAVLRAGLRAGLLNAYRIEDHNLAGRLAALPREI